MLNRDVLKLLGMPQSTSFHPGDEVSSSCTGTDRISEIVGEDVTVTESLEKAAFKRFKEHILKDKNFFLVLEGRVSYNFDPKDVTVTIGDKQYSLVKTSHQHQLVPYANEVRSMLENWKKEWESFMQPKRKKVGVIPDWLIEHLEYSGVYVKAINQELYLIIEKQTQYSPNQMLKAGKLCKILNPIDPIPITVRFHFLINKNDVMLKIVKCFRGTSSFQHYHTYSSGSADCLGTLKGAKARREEEIYEICRRYIKSLEIINADSLASSTPSDVPDLSFYKLEELNPKKGGDDEW